MFLLNNMISLFDFLKYNKNFNFMKRCIIVPFDFSNEANFALYHAYELTKKQNIPIHLLHVTKKESDIEEWLQELKKIADKFSIEYENCEVLPVVRSGNLFNKIHEYGIESNAYLAVMGTHGINTINKAMKVIKKFVKIPFVLVQRPVTFGEYNRICVPIDWDKKCRAKFLWVKYLSDLFESKVYIVYPETTNVERKATINANLKFAGSIFEKECMDFEVTSLSDKDYADNLYDYMNGIEPDIVLFMTNQYKEYILELRRPRNIELYKKIPIMCVNPRTDIIKLGNFN
jgi:hypothetical protein